MLSCVIDADEHCDVATIGIPGTFLQADMDDVDTSLMGKWLINWSVLTLTPMVHLLRNSVENSIVRPTQKSIVWDTKGCIAVLGEII